MEVDGHGSVSSGFSVHSLSDMHGARRNSDMSHSRVHAFSEMCCCYPLPCWRAWRVTGPDFKTHLGTASSMFPSCTLCKWDLF